MLKNTAPFGDIEVFDAHTHFFSRRFFETLTPLPIERVAELTGWTMPPAEPENLAATWRTELDRHHVAGALAIASIPGDEDSVARAVAAAPDRMAGAFMFDPTKPETESRVKHAFDGQKLRIACLFPAMHHFSIAESEGARALASAVNERAGTAVFVHCGALSVGVRRKLGLPSLFDMRRSNPLDIYRLASEFSKARFIVPHFGAGMFREAMMLADLCPNVYIDTSSTNKWMNYEATPIDLATVFKRALNVVGHERLLFGTDSSFFPRGWVSGVFDAQVAALHASGASREQAQAIFGRNMRKLVGFKEARSSS